MAIERVFLVGDQWGVYVPLRFAVLYVQGAECPNGGAGWSVSADDLVALLAGPDRSPDYWEAWDAVLRDARYTDAQGRVWTLEQDGDLFAVTGDDDEGENV